MTTASIVAQLNDYTGENIWQDVILPGLDLNEAATNEIDPCTSSDRFVLADGTIICWDPQTGQWYNAGEYEGDATDDAATTWF